MTPLDRISQLTDETRDLRARVADLEADASLHWITEVELRQSRARVAELVAALEALLALHDPDGKFEPHGNKPALAQARAILARTVKAL